VKIKDFMKSSLARNKRLNSNPITINLFFLAMAILETSNFMWKICGELYTRKGLDALIVNKVSYTLLELKFDITQGTYNHVFTVWNYPLIPISFAIMYNIYFAVKISKNKV